MKKMHVAIVGAGLIGGSLGLAFKKHYGSDLFVSALDSSEETCRLAVERGAADEASTDIRANIEGADIIFLSTPVLQIVPMVEKLLPYLKPGAILSDTGSTKQYVWQRLQKLLPPGVHYVSGHPMAGKEHSGIRAADADLFRHKCYVIVEDTGAPPEAVAAVRALVEATGASVTAMDIEKHDRCASVISHVPHVAAAALVTLLNNSREDIEANLKLAGGGFKDTTRIASSNADMWADICISNPEAIAQHLRDLQAILGDVITAIERSDRQRIHDYFTAAKQRRDNILDRTQNLFEI